MSIGFRVAGPGTSAAAAARGWLLTWAVHVPTVVWLFGDAFWSGRLLYFRDLSNQYAPTFAFAAESARRGVWPLWNPTIHAGEPFLLAYPVDLFLLWAGGWHACLGVGPALHLWLALAGGTYLGRRLGLSPWAAWLTGTAYGLSGFVLSLVNLLQLFEASAWAPWVIASVLALARRPTARCGATLALLLALQTSTLGAEIVAQTLVVALVLSLDASWLRPRRWLPLLASGVLATALAAPALAGAAWLARGTARASGFVRDEALAFSLHPGTLPELALPRWLGDPHAFSDADYWGASFFPEGYPYLVSLYAGAGVLLLATQAGRRRRLWFLVTLGVLLALGSHGPLAALPGGLRLPVRGPQKLLFLAQVGISLLAGFGLDRREREPLRGARLALLAVASAAWAALALAVCAAPDGFLAVAGRLLPELHGPRAAVAARVTWPAAWIPAGLLALAAGLALARGGRVARLAALAAALDLASANGSLNPLAPAPFYDLRPEVAELLRPVREQGGRIFSYGVAQTPGLAFEPVMRAARSDVWLYYLDRQSLLPSTPVLDRLDTAGGPDQTGFTPAGASLLPAEAVPERFREHYDRLRAANVRWVLSFAPLPDDLVSPRGEVRFPEVAEPLRLYELRDPLPRAYYVDRLEHALGRGAPAENPAQVVYEAVDPHTVRLRCRTPPGFIVVLDGYNADWKALDGSHAVPIQPVAGRYRAVPTPGGDRVITLKLTPPWRAPALAGLAFAAVLALGLLVVPGVSGFTGTRRPPC